MKMSVLTAVALLAIAPFAAGEDGPRTGYFQTTTTPLELLGEEGAKVLSSVFAADEKLTWQLSVPKNYDSTKPAGVMVFIGYAEWGGGKREWTSVLEDRNVIWIGLMGGGDKKPLDERMLKAILAQAVLERDYKIDLSRYYLFGYSGGAQVAAILATSRPELFRGTLFYGDALFWGDQLPSKIDLIRDNKFMFMAGARDTDVRKIRKVAKEYKDAGVAYTDTFFVTNVDRKMPAARYFDAAIGFLDSGVPLSADSE